MHDAAALPSPRLRALFPRRMRLTHAREYQAVYESRTRHDLGIMAVYAVPNGLDHCRIGLSVPKHVGTAVMRHRLKRMIREAFRLSQHQLAPGYDLVIALRRHQSLALEEYQRLFIRAAGALHERWTQRHAKARHVTHQSGDNHQSAAPESPRAD